MNTPGIIPARPGPEAERQDVLPTRDDAFAGELAAAIKTAPAETDNPDTGTGDVLPPDEPGSPNPEPPTPPATPNTPGTEPGRIREPDAKLDASAGHPAQAPAEPALSPTVGQSDPDGAHVVERGAADDPGTSREPSSAHARMGTQLSLGLSLEPPTSPAPDAAGLPAGNPPQVRLEGVPNGPGVTPIIPAAISPSPSGDPIGPLKEAPAPLPAWPNGAEASEAMERFDAFARLTRTRDGRAEVNLGGRDGHFTVSVRPDAGEVFLTARLTSRSLLEAFDASAQELADALSRHGLDLAGFDTGPRSDRQPPGEHETRQDPADPAAPFADRWRRPKIVA